MVSRPPDPPSRIVIDAVTPLVAGGRYAVKRVVGEPVTVGATVFADGHDEVHVVVSHRPPGGEAWVDVAMASINPGLDRWEATFVPDAVGRHEFRVRAWIDPPTGSSGARRDELASDVVAVDVESERALFSTWYELFPRSCPPGRHAGRTSPRTSTTLAELGFDVLYLPPIHPIGTSAPQGAQQPPRPPSPATPAARGRSASAEGGHTAVHPELGTVADVGRARRRRPRARASTLALDIAFQCSPDHPWVTEHPEWFRHRPDGIDPVRGEPAEEVPGHLPARLRVRGVAGAVGRRSSTWRCSGCDQGVRIFRVDNPHTKPFAFWEWLHRARCAAAARRRSSWPRRSPARR